MKRLTLVLVCAVALAMTAMVTQRGSAQVAPTSADPDPAQVAAATDLVNAMDADAQAMASLQQLKQALIARMQASEPSKVVGFTAYTEKAMQPEGSLVSGFLSDMRNIAVQFYARNFTPDEMKEIAKFQASPAGRKFNKITPELGGLIASRMGRFQTDLIQAVEKGSAADAK